uniref:50S ribosomal protein L9 n=1 Tax=Sporochnus bolleanus TaxID=461143 RepID=UPI002E798370|nr:50S ribosomal protein L9 [Sporochnus bolleanus]WAM64946.1 50S ribosomal protein L9 [Sporochnus bolleanus]
MRKKTIQVILTRDVQKLGKQGNLIKVKPGYLRNYLIPLKLGKIATPSLINQFNFQQKELELKQIEFFEKCVGIKELLEGLENLKIWKKISKNGVFFGKITKKQILELLKTKLDLTIELTKNQLQLPEMKQLGNYVIEIILTPNVIAKINVEILPE